MRMNTLLSVHLRGDPDGLLVLPPPRCRTVLAVQEGVSGAGCWSERLIKRSGRPRGGTNESSGKQTKKT